MLVKPLKYAMVVEQCFLISILEDLHFFVATAATIVKSVPRKTGDLTVFHGLVVPHLPQNFAVGLSDFPQLSQKLLKIPCLCSFSFLTLMKRESIIKVEETETKIIKIIIISIGAIYTIRKN